MEGLANEPDIDLGLIHKNVSALPLRISAQTKCHILMIDKLLKLQYHKTTFLMIRRFATIFKLYSLLQGAGKRIIIKGGVK